MRARLRLLLFMLMTAALVTLLTGAFDAEAQRLRGQSRTLAPSAGNALRLISYNIRVQDPSDGENNWPNRRDLVASVLRFHQADIACLQEAYRPMIADLVERLPGFEWYGVGSTDGKESGACNPVFFRASRLQLLSARTFWFSPMPNHPGKGWDAAFPRTATQVRLRDLSCGRVITVFNVHLDHEGEHAREQSARLLLREIRALSDEVLVAGDFNCTSKDQPVRLLTSFGLRCAREASLTGHFGLTTSFNDFQSKWPCDLTIDHVMVSEGIVVQQEGIPAVSFDGRHASDHFPVIVEIGP